MMNNNRLPERDSRQFSILYTEICATFGLYRPNNKCLSLIEKIARIMVRIGFGAHITALLSSIMLVMALLFFFINLAINLSIALIFCFIFAWVGLLEMSIAISVIQINLTLKFINTIKLLGYSGDIILLIATSIVIKTGNAFSVLMILFAGIAICMYEWIIIVSLRLSKPVNVLLGSRISRCIASSGVTLSLLPFTDIFSSDIIIGISCTSIAIVCGLGATIGYARLSTKLNHNNKL